MNKIIKIFLFFFFSILLIYILLPNPDFPAPPPDSVQSAEPADTETPFRRAYFTNLSRQEVIEHYKREFNKNLKVYVRSNYPPEEAQSIIRDQTMSTYLEEISHPFRESIYINGFEPKSENNTIMINGVNWNQKIIIRFVPSSVGSRVLIYLLIVLSIFLFSKEIRK